MEEELDLDDLPRAVGDSVMPVQMDQEAVAAAEPPAGGGGASSEAARKRDASLLDHQLSKANAEPRKRAGGYARFPVDFQLSLVREVLYGGPSVRLANVASTMGFSSAGETSFVPRVTLIGWVKRYEELRKKAVERVRSLHPPGALWTLKEDLFVDSETEDLYRSKADISKRDKSLAHLRWEIDTENEAVASITAMRLAGLPLSHKLVELVLRDAIARLEPGLLRESNTFYQKGLALSHGTVSNFLARNNFVQRCFSSKVGAKGVSEDIISAASTSFILRMALTVMMNNIPENLVSGIFQVLFSINYPYSYLHFRRCTMQISQASCCLECRKRLTHLQAKSVSTAFRLEEMTRCSSTVPLVYLIYIYLFILICYILF